MDARAAGRLALGLLGERFLAVAQPSVFRLCIRLPLRLALRVGALRPNDDAALDLLAVGGLERLPNLLFADLHTLAAQLGQHQLGLQNVFLPLEEALLDALEVLLDEALAADVESLDALFESILDLGGGDLDVLRLAGGIDDVPIDEGVELVGAAAGDEVVAEFFAGDGLGLVQVGDDAMVVVGIGRSGGGGGRGGLRLGPGQAAVPNAVPASDDSRDAQSAQSEPAPPLASGTCRAGVRHLFASSMSMIGRVAGKCRLGRRGIAWTRIGCKGKPGVAAVRFLDERGRDSKIGNCHTHSL